MVKRESFNKLYDTLNTAVDLLSALQTRAYGANSISSTIGQCRIVLREYRDERFKEELINRRDEG